MNREETKKLLPFITAFANGLTVQYRNPNGPTVLWTDCDRPEWHASCEYRIKPQTIKSRRYVYGIPSSGQMRVGIVYEGALTGYLMRDADNDADNIARVESITTFVGWIDNDWVESEIPSVKK